jgi:G8 domain
MTTTSSSKLLLYFLFLWNITIDLLHQNVVTAQQPTVINCQSSDQITVIIGGTRRACSYFKSRQRLCTNIDTSTGTVVGLICAKQCPLVSGCQTPASVPVPKPIPTTPVLAPVTTPVRAPASVPVTIPVAPPVPVTVPVVVTTPVQLPVATAPSPVRTPASVPVPKPIQATPVTIPVAPPAPVTVPVVVTTPVQLPVATAPSPVRTPASVPIPIPIPVAPVIVPITTPIQVPVLLPVTVPVAPPVPVTIPVVVTTPVQLPVAMAPVQTPASVPVPILIPVAPVITPVTTPVRAPASVPVTIPVAPPVPVTVPVVVTTPIQLPVPVTVPVPIAFDYPPGPYISHQQSSEVVTIPRPSLTFTDNADTNATNCPHLDPTTLKQWHDVSTWGTRLPQAGENVTLPTNTRVLVSQSIVESLGIVTIPATSQLVFGSNPAGITVSARGFQVFGKFIAGSPTCHIYTPVTVTLTGARPSDVVTSVPAPEIKGISVDGGQLLLYGRRYTHTWTRLAKTVTPGAKVLTLQEYVNWTPGQKIVLVTSSMKDARDYNQNEILTIQAVHNNNLPSGVGSIVYVLESVQHNHVATRGYQVEVGLLSRTITIQGDPQSEPTDLDPGTCQDEETSKSNTVYFNTSSPCMNMERTGYGGHIMIHNNGIGQVEGVQLYRMGQTNVMGRYPMHFHFLGSCPLCYFTGNSIHHSFYRCIAVHGSHNTTVSENVGYDVTGYCYYLEAGIEEDNMISYNLAAYIHPIMPNAMFAIRGVGHISPNIIQSSNLTIPADTTASGFYITNVHNNIIGNAASGGWAGFHFPILDTPIGDITVRTMKYRPSSVTSLTIDGNTAHSSGWWWRNASPFYFGGALAYHNMTTGILTYMSGRVIQHKRNTCTVNACVYYNDCARCEAFARRAVRITNTKSFLTAGASFVSQDMIMYILF